jgi:2-hydroxychromene-2-carboxylate isomerase
MTNERPIGTARSVMGGSTSSKTIEFFFDFRQSVPRLRCSCRAAREAGAQLVYRPMLLGGVFKANGAPVWSPCRRRADG